MQVNDSAYQYNKPDIQIKRQRNMEKFNLKNDYCSSTHTAMSGGKLGTGVADFIESGSNYG